MIPKNRLILILGSLFLILVIAPFYIRCICLAKISVKVVDEAGKPVDGANISTYFRHETVDKPAIEGFADHEGNYNVWSRTTNGMIFGGTSKSGFYDSIFSVMFFNKLFGFWHPWNKQATVTMRPVINSVPMYVRNLDKIEVPKSGKEIGYDLMESDWVKPYGKGTHPDFIFKMDHWFESMTEHSITMTLSFPNKNDGIQVIKQEVAPFSSHYKLPRTAPEDGYKNQLIKKSIESVKRREFVNDYESSNNYIFRVRTETDKNGKVKRAMYGKILGELNTFFSDNNEKIVIRMHYYLNPDHTRNLEFDPKRNLFTNLPKNENVSMP